MFTLISFIFVLLTTKVYCQNVTVQFQTFPVNTDIGSCTCDLTASKCDVSCCCDLDCTSYDQQAFSCTSRDNKYTNTTPILSTVQPSCYKNLSIFESNSPYIIQKMGELVCIDFQRYSGSQYYQQPNVQTLDPGSFVRTINRENSVSAPSGLSTNLTFYENDSSSSSSSGVARNPGYLQSANLIVGIENGSAVELLSSSKFSILQPLSTGYCDLTNTQRMPISFGENVRSTCKYNVSTTQTTCPNLYDLLMPINSTNLYVAAYSNSDQFNITTDWLPVISCVSEIGSPSNRLCQNGIKISPSVNGLCDVKLDIQIAYTKIGSISNPQSVLSAVIFHYQGRTVASTDPLSETLLVMESVTFQDISITPVTEQGQIPSPNARLPADFFYPFSTNQATKFMKYSLFHYLLISILFSLM
ncbi:unnamed protein product [Rotaria sp. Silwood1]|nr:unnamed protein product [Rotaria sp. Silwood1]